MTLTVLALVAPVLALAGIFIRLGRLLTEVEHLKQEQVQTGRKIVRLTDGFNALGIAVARLQARTKSSGPHVMPIIWGEGEDDEN